MGKPARQLQEHQTMTNILTSSPWGQVLRCTPAADGILRVHAASHGGFKLCPELQQQMPAFFPETFPGGWYDQESAWAQVVVVFPQFFTPATVAYAVYTIRRFLADSAPALAYVASGLAADIAKAHDGAHADHWRTTDVRRPFGQGAGWVVRFADRATSAVRFLLMPNYPTKADYAPAELQGLQELPQAA
jgi:hypothetical protein